MYYLGCPIVLCLTTPYFQASVYVREWAVERWGEGSAVRLIRDLPQLKEEARRRYEDMLEENARNE